MSTCPRAPSGSRIRRWAMPAARTAHRRRFKQCFRVSRAERTHDAAGRTKPSPCARPAEADTARRTNDRRKPSSATGHPAMSRRRGSSAWNADRRRATRARAIRRSGGRAMSTPRYRLGVDVGGTFTDFVLLDERSGALAREKCLTTPDDPVAGIMHGIERLQRAAPCSPSTSRRRSRHDAGHEHADRAQRRRTGLLATEGFRDCSSSEATCATTCTTSRSTSRNRSCRARRGSAFPSASTQTVTRSRPPDLARLRDAVQTAGRRRGDIGCRVLPAQLSATRHTNAPCCDSSGASFRNWTCRSPRPSRRRSASTSARSPSSRTPT